MATILDEIIAHKRLEVKQDKELVSLSSLVDKIQDIEYNKLSFAEAIQKSDSGIIAEFKRKSPSKGWIHKESVVENVVTGYSQAGAAAISVLTDKVFFGGSLKDLEEASSSTTTPLLRKDFVVDEYQLYQAKLAGASAVLLIAAALSVNEVLGLSQKAKKLGLDVLLEIHNEQELDALNTYVDVVGVNNRNLKTFKTEIETSFRLVDKIPNDFIKISESGISKAITVKELRGIGYQGFLMGENFMKEEYPAQALAKFIKDLQ